MASVPETAGRRGEVGPPELRLQVHAESIGQAIHEREIGGDLDGMQYGLIRVAGCTHRIHVSSGDSGRGTCQLAGILQQRPQLWRQQIMAPIQHSVDQCGIPLYQTERRPVMFDSVVALVRA
jgi:hypothetical protein